MKKYLIIISLLILALCLFLINTNNKTDNHNDITYTNNIMQNDIILENTEFLEEWETSIIGTLEIPSLNLKFKVADGIDDYILKDYVGHFTTTPLFKGNVGMITNNSLENVKKNDEIKYNFMFGEKTYIVEEIIEIQDDYYNYLEDTEDNRLTLIIFAENTMNLCIKSKEKHRLMPVPKSSCSLMVRKWIH